MMRPLEPVGGRRLAERALKGCFNRRIEGDIDDYTTDFTDQMVVVLAGDGLGEFETGMVIGGNNAMHDPGVLKHHQVAIGGTLSKVVTGLQQFGDGGRAWKRQQRFNHRSTVRGVALGRRRQLCGRQLMDVADNQAGPGYFVHLLFPSPGLLGPLRLVAGGVMLAVSINFENFWECQSGIRFDTQWNIR